MKKDKVSIIGAGRVGTALGVLLHGRGYPIVGVASRTLASARRCGELTGCELVTLDPAEAARPGKIIFITTGDELIREVCDRIAQGRGFGEGDLVVHASGALASDELVSAKGKGALTLSMHPVQTFADAKSAVEKLPGSYFGLEGEEEAIERGREIVRDLEGRAVAIPGGAKVLYHAGACVASNYLVALFHLSLSLWRKADIGGHEGLRMLMPLIRGTVDNVERVGIPSALTGPIERGESETLRTQLSSIGEKAPELLRMYAKLAEYTLEVAEKKGNLTEERAEKLREVLEET